MRLLICTLLKSKLKPPSQVVSALTDSALLCFRVGGSVMAPHQSVPELLKLFVHKNLFISNVRTLYRTGKK